MESRNEIRQKEEPQAVLDVRETAQHVFSGRTVQERQGARPVPAVSQEPVGLGVAAPKCQSSTLKAYAARLLLWGAAFGPTAVIIADRVAHFFGVCLGH